MSQSVVRPFTPEQSVPGSSMALEAIVDRLIGRIYTNLLVQVTEIHSEIDEVSAVGFVDVISLTQQVDGNNEGIPNGTMFRLPFFRVQGGGNAVILNPSIGDIGLACICMRDISSIKETPVSGAPPSRRQYDVSDGLYIGGFLNQEPEQYIHFLESGMNIVSTGDVNLTTPENLNIECSDFNVSCESMNINCEEDLTVTASNITMLCDDDINMSASAVNIEASSMNVDCPQSTFSGNVSAANIAASGSISDGSGEMGDLRDAHNDHVHTSESPGNPTSSTDLPV